MAPVPRIPRDYGIALATPMLAFLFTLLLAPGAKDWHWPLFMAAVVASALFGGKKFGLIAGSFCILLLVFHHTLLLSDRPPWPEAGFFPRVACFLVLASLAIYLCHVCKRSAAATFQLPETLASMHFAVIFADANGRVTFLNSVAERLTGWTTKSAAKERLGKVFLAVDENGQQIAQNPVARLISDQRASGAGGTVLLVTHDGAERPVEYWAEPHQDARGTTWGVSLLFRDKSDSWRQEKDLREREQRFRALAEQAPAAVLVLNEAGECSYANPNCLALAGMDREQAAGPGFARLLHPDDRQIAEAWALAARDGDSFSREVRLQDASGRVRWARLRAAPLLTDDEMSVGHVCILEDINPLKELEQQLQEHRQAREAMLRYQQEVESQHEEKLSAVEKARSTLQEQLAKHRRAEEKLKQEQERIQKERKQVEDQLRQKEAEVTQWTNSLQQEEAKRERVEHNLRQEQQLTQAQEMQLGELNRRLTELTQTSSRMEEEQAERGRLLESLRGELQRTQAKAKGIEDSLTRDVDDLQGRLSARAQEAEHSEAELRRELASQEGHRRRTEAITAATKELAACQDTEAVLRKAVVLAKPLLADWSIAHFHPSEGSAPNEPLAITDGPPAVGVVQWLLHHPGYQADVVSQTVRTGQPICYSDLADTALARLPHTKNGVTPEELTATSLICLPLIVESKSVGAVTLIRGRVSEALGPENRALAEEFGRCVADALTCARLREKLRELQEQFKQHQATVEESEQQRGRLEEIAKRREAFLERLLREVRQPLARTREELVELENHVRRDPWSWEATQNIQGQLGSLGLLVDGLRDLTALAHGRLEVQKEQVELAAMFSSVSAAAEPFLKDRSHHLTVSLPLTPVVFAADQARLEQVLLHLLHNAAKFTPAGGRIFLTAELDGEELVLKVQDNGKGIGAERLTGLFDQYAKPARSEVDAGEGLGVGLALVRGLVELHEGHVAVASSGPGQGSVFTVRLPMPAKPASAPQEPATLVLPIERVRRAG